MRKLARFRNEQGITLMEVLIAIPILVIGILAVMSTLTVGFVDVTMSGGQGKATTYARQQLELLKNQAFTVVQPVPANDVPEPGMTRAWTIQQVGATPAPNRLSRITVRVTWRPGGSNATTGTPQSITLETMRAE